MNHFSRTSAALFLLGFAAVCGCSGTPAAPPKAKVDPAAAGAAAIAAYDADKDGKLSPKELEKCPALKSAMDRIDKNHTGAITAEMIADRIKYWLDSGTTLMEGSALVTLDGKPLQGATVTFEPEAFLGPGFKASSGATDNTGTIIAKAALENFPGVYVAFYKVRISKKVNGQETIPARYNTETILGEEIAPDVMRPTRMMVFALGSDK